MQALLPSFAIAALPIDSIAPQAIAQQIMAAAASSFEFLILSPFDARTLSSHASFERIDERQFRAFFSNRRPAACEAGRYSRQRQ